jgi:hypothetical protein
MAEHFDRGLSRLVAEGDLTRDEAREARSTFADWAEANGGDGCAFRDELIDAGRAFLDYVELSPAEIRDGFRDDQSLAAMVEEATDGEVSRDELIDYLSDAIGDRLEALEADGALTPEVRDAIEQKVGERIPTAVDAEGGPQMKHGGPGRR